MVVLSLECPERESEIVSAELWECGATGIHEEPLPPGRCRLKAWFDEAGTLAERFARWSPTIAEEVERDWEAEVHASWHPFPVGARFWLVPEWDSTPAPDGRIRLTIHPGLALGTGTHAATQHCLRALERHVQPGDTILDVGAGTGILSSAAHLLGASHVVACDMDTDSVAIARTNALADGVPIRLFAGSTRALRGGCFDVVVANINGVTHQSLADEYTRLSRRTLIVSGYTHRDANAVLAALARTGWSVLDTLSETEWVCHALCRTP